MELLVFGFNELLYNVNERATPVSVAAPQHGGTVSPFL
jgi:hypothetical protein